MLIFSLFISVINILENKPSNLLRGFFYRDQMIQSSQPI